MGLGFRQRETAALTEHDEPAAVHEAVEAAPGVGVGRGVPHDGALLPAVAQEVAAVDAPHVVVLRPREHPQPVLVHRRKVAAHHLGGHMAAAMLIKF